MSKISTAEAYYRTNSQNNKQNQNYAQLKLQLFINI